MRASIGSPPVPSTIAGSGEARSGHARTGDRPPRSKNPSRSGWTVAGVAATAFLVLAFAVPSLPEEWRSPFGRDRGSEGNRIVAEATPALGTAPTSLRIPAIGLDAVVRPVAGDDPLPFPPGPSIVGWDAAGAAPGDGGNVVMAGHNDYWSTGPAVFWGPSQIAPGGRVEVVAGDGTIYVYEVKSGRSYPAASLSREQLNEIVGPTGEESLTLITDSGEFDYSASRYVDRLVVRAVLVERLPGADASPTASQTTPAPFTARPTPR